MKLSESNRYRHRRLLTVIGVAALVVTAGDWASAYFLSDLANNESGPVHAAINVTVLSKEPSNLPATYESKASVLLIGNSHTYALPGLRNGEPLRPIEGRTLTYDVAELVSAHYPSRKEQVQFYRLSYPNFLPFEMLTRVGHLLYSHRKPSIVVVGLTWRNIARDTETRYQIAQAYRDGAFATAFKKMLTATDVEADPAVSEAIEREERAAAFEAATERTRSYADRLDGAFASWAGARISLIGQSSELRARLYRQVNYGIASLVLNKGKQAPSYDVIAADLDFNVKCLRAMLRLLKANHISAICYFAPERSDLPPMIDVEQQAREMGALKEFAEHLGFVVVDAKNVVPNQYWGWDRNTPDRSHFTEPGHQLLAKFLVEEMDKHHMWDSLQER
jgi:hypothetical protein